MGNNSIKKMTDKEKLELILKHHAFDGSSFESIVINYLNTFSADFSAYRLLEFINKLNNEPFRIQLAKDANVISVSSERAMYLRDYLSGNMWKDEESARKNLQPQINNAQAIIDACKVSKSLKEPDIFDML